MHKTKKEVVGGSFKSFSTALVYLFGKHDVNIIPKDNHCIVFGSLTICPPFVKNPRNNRIIVTKMVIKALL